MEGGETDDEWTDDPTLVMLATTSFAASFANRPVVVTPTSPPATKLNEKQVPASVEGVTQLAVRGQMRMSLELT